MASNSAAEIVRHYTKADEVSRLRTGWFQLEQARTRELILRHLPPTPARVVDVGGGAGAYACWLASLGYEVHLIDPVPRHVEQARAASEAQPQSPLASATLGDARKIEQADQSADALLMLGPLYHLTERSDRLTALREARRVARTGAPVFVAAISRFSSLLDSLSGGFFDQPEFAAILDRGLAEGQHRNPTDNLLYFTDAVFHRPDELASEIRESGLELVEVLPIEGPGWLARDFDRLWNDSGQRERLLAALRKIEHEPSLIGASSHLLAIGRNATGRTI
jgi:ubiquinone/menaquinone biosynthesis C-methylase UbiE